MDDSHIGVPASTARRGPGMKTCRLAVVDLPGHDVTGRSQRSHYKRVKVVYVVRPLGLFLALQCMSFPLGIRKPRPMTIHLDRGQDAPGRDPGVIHRQTRPRSERVDIAHRRKGHH